MYGNDQFQDIIGTDYWVGDCLISITVGFHFFGLIIVLNFDDVLNDIWLAVNNDFCDKRSHSAIIFISDAVTNRLHMKKPSFQHRNSDYRNKMVSQTPYLYNGNIHTWKTIFILRWTPKNRRCRTTKEQYHHIHYIFLYTCSYFYRRIVVSNVYEPYGGSSWVYWVYTLARESCGSNLSCVIFKHI